MASNVHTNLPLSDTLHIFTLIEATCKWIVAQHSNYGNIEVESSSKNLVTKCRTIASMMLAGENVLEGYPDPDDGAIAAHQSPNWLTEPGMVRMEAPVTTLSLGTAAGLLTVEADCETETGKCKSV
jgi:hypothetical protein